jgi:sec-independent protein translocase protein TatA
MGAFSVWHLLIAGAVVALLFGGGGKISSILGDAGQGLRAFRMGLRDEPSESETDAG